MLKFSEDHEWVRLDGDIAEIGISPHAVEQLGDIVFIELPDIGTNVTKAMRLPFLNRSKRPLISTARLAAKLLM